MYRIDTNNTPHLLPSCVYVEGRPEIERRTFVFQTVPSGKMTSQPFWPGTTVTSALDVLHSGKPLIPRQDRTVWSP